MKKKEPNFTWNATIEELAKLRKPVVSESVCKHVFTAYDNTINDYRCIWCGQFLKQTIR